MSALENESQDGPTSSSEMKQLQQLIIDKNYEIENISQQLNDFKTKVNNLTKQSDDMEKEYAKSSTQLSSQISTLQGQILDLKSDLERSQVEQKIQTQEAEKL